MRETVSEVHRARFNLKKRQVIEITPTSEVIPITPSEFLSTTLCDLDFFLPHECEPKGHSNIDKFFQIFKFIYL